MDSGEKIKEILNKFGSRIVVAAHHYQNENIVKYANFVGDSYKLAVECSKSDAEYIILCGVYFMAESASILAKANQKIILPDLQAGCPMADMITGNIASVVVNKIQTLTNKNVAPVVYMNSYIDSKSVCGQYDGSVCTSSNAKKILKYYIDQDRPVFFYPDFHLGNNCANELGLSQDERAVVRGDLSIHCTGDISKAKIFLFNGFCHVHQNFEVDDINAIRKKFPDIKVIVHPECNSQVVKNSDFNGSTEYIYKKVSEAEKGSKWAIGTEFNFISRLALANQDKTIIPLKVAPCFNMAKITEEKLLQTLISIQNNDKELLNLIKVDDNLKKNAMKSLTNMIEIVER